MEYVQTYSIFSMMKKITICSLCLLLSVLGLCTLTGQTNDMQTGLYYLNKGDYEKAEQFFEQILLSDANNKTAQINYNRAIGLKGKTNIAILNFLKLQEQYPDDYQVQLNLAEAYMWDKQYRLAARLYEQLIRKDKTDSNALTGYIRALTATENFIGAINFAKQLQLLEPENKNAQEAIRISNLGYANQMKRQNNFKDAEYILLELDSTFPADEYIYNNIAELYIDWNRISDANTIYKKMESLEMNPFLSYNGLSKTSLILHKRKSALRYAEKAIELNSEDRYEKIISGINYTRALAANNKYAEAFYFLEEMEEAEGTDLQIDLEKAKLNLQNKSFRKAHEEYLALEKRQANNYQIKMGIVESLIALKKKNKAITKLKEALSIEPGGVDAERLLEKLKQESRPLLHLYVDRNTDIGQNNSTIFGTEIQFNKSESFTPSIFVNRKNTSQDDMSSASIIRAGVGNILQIRPSLQLITDLGIAKISCSRNSREELIYNLAIKGQLGKALNLELGIDRDLQDYSPTLLDENIRFTNYYLSYNFDFSKKIGAYSQFIRTTQNDGNKRNYILASLFYSITQYPNIKLGAEFSSFEFLFSRQEYFSPNYYQNVEAFLQLSNLEYENQTFLYDIVLALGRQKIENDTSESTRRIELKTGYRFNKKTRFLLGYLHSNAAKVSALGLSSNNFNLDFYLYL